MRDKLSLVFVITRREIRDQFRDWRIILPIIILTMVFPALMNYTADFAVRFVQKYGASIVGERLIPFLLMIVGFFPTTVSLVIALESFVGEKERRSIEPLLASPLEDWQLYVGKLLAVLVPPVMGSCLGIIVYLIGIYRGIGWVAPIDLLIQVIVITFVQTLVMVCGAVVISTQATSVRAANLMVSFVVIPVALLMQAESAVMFWGQYHALWWVTFGLIIVAGLLIRTGIGHFNREVLLGREVDVLDFKWMWRVYNSALKGNAKTITEWLRIEIKRVLSRMWLPALFVFVAIVGGFIVGVSQANVFRIPSDMLRIEELHQGSIEGFEVLSVFDTSSVLLLWFHNSRAIVLATLAGVFSYGVLGLLILMLPFIIIGYLAGTFSSIGISIDTMLLGFVLPHGIFEIPAIALAGAAILRLGATLAAQTKEVSISEGLLKAFADWTKTILLFVLPLLLLAAVMEALVTIRFGFWLLGQ
jgi:uncharacterized membrane protein SpoIIM required for sporulation